MQYIIRYTVCRRAPKKSAVRAAELWYVCFCIRFITHLWQSALTIPVFSVSLPFVWNIAMPQLMVNWNSSESVFFRKQEGAFVNSSLDRDWQIQHIILISHMIGSSTLSLWHTPVFARTNVSLISQYFAPIVRGGTLYITVANGCCFLIFPQRVSCYLCNICIKKTFCLLHEKKNIFSLSDTYSSIQMETIHSTFFRYTKSKHTYIQYLYDSCWRLNWNCIFNKYLMVRLHWKCLFVMIKFAQKCIFHFPFSIPCSLCTYQLHKRAMRKQHDGDSERYIPGIYIFQKINRCNWSIIEGDEPSEFITYSTPLLRLQFMNSSSSHSQCEF